MAAMRWLPFLCLAVAAAGSMLQQARAQADSKGFISIDCGHPGETYVETDTKAKLQFAPDAGFIDSGSNHDISVEYMSSPLPKFFQNVRSFPEGTRNCYKIPSLVRGLKYLIRALFMYGNYDGLNTSPMFDLYIGANFWTTVNMSRGQSDKYLLAEAMVVVPDDYVHVCLVNTGAGTPFISALELRPLKSMLYPQVSAKQGLNLLSRFDLGTGSKTRVIRYPDDPHDRLWRPVDTSAEYSSITTFKIVQSPNDDLFHVPTEVMETAITGRNASANIEITMHPQPQPGYIAILHFAELRILRGNAVRQFYVNVNGKRWYPDAYTPGYLSSSAIYGAIVPDQQGTVDISIEATAGSTLPPILNAFEIFSVMSTTKVDTESEDGTPSPTPTTNAGSKDGTPTPTGNFGSKSEDDICIGGGSCKKSNKLVLYIAVPIAGLVVIGSAAALIFCLLRRKKQGSI